MDNMPKHIAIIMDGNGRWAQKRRLPRAAGHKAGLDAAQKIIKYCGDLSIEVLTLFAFSSENWRRPPAEVNHLMTLMLTALKQDVKRLHKNNVQLRFIGDRSQFNDKIQQGMSAAETLTHENTGLKLLIAANYGGQWDIIQAMQKVLDDAQASANPTEQLNVERLEQHLSFADLPDPDLFIRTSGECRISNFLLWQLAYTELYFTDILWPDFDCAALDEALSCYARRQRRYGGVESN